jgi:hypothetical protein
LWRADLCPQLKMAEREAAKFAYGEGGARAAERAQLLDQCNHTLHERAPAVSCSERAKRLSYCLSNASKALYLPRTAAWASAVAGHGLAHVAAIATLHNQLEWAKLNFDGLSPVRSTAPLSPTALTALWRLSGGSLAALWRLSGGSLAALWRLSGGSLAAL